MMKRSYLYFLALLITLYPVNISSAQNGNSYRYIDKIVLDAGHGGYDPGAQGNKSKEKDITLAIALEAGRIIEEKFPGIEVIYTRKEDRFVKLHDRAKIANENAADLFISIHCNSNPSAKPFGSETYVMGLHKSQENLEVAKTENAAILLEDDHEQQYDGFDPNLDEDYIVLSMFQSANIEQSLGFSQILQDRMRTSVGMYDRGVRQAGFVVLYLTTMPGVLFETGFLSNPGEEKFLMEKENQEKIARAIAEAVGDYKILIESELEAISTINNRNDSAVNRKVNKVYRIEFARMKSQKPEGHKMFNGMKDVWYYYNNGRYCYTFGYANSFDKAKGLYQKAILEDKIKWKYLKSAEIVEFEGDEVVSKMKAIGDGIME